MAGKTEILHQLNKILESDLFKKSGINSTLLTLLVESTLAERKLKEATIGYELFGKNYDPLKNDTKVRVYVHNLRKKLAEYYDQTGQQDPVIFSIEKGNYVVLFHEHSDTKSNKGTKVTLLAILFVLAIGSGMIYRHFAISGGGGFWDVYFESKMPTTVLVGDHFMIEGPIPLEGSGLIRSFNVNSANDFSNYIRNHPQDAALLNPSRYGYVTKMGPVSIKDIGYFFWKNGSDFQLLLSSEWDKSKLGAENLIYFGQFKTMGFLQNVFRENNHLLAISGSSITLTDPVTTTKTTYHSSTGNPTIDYAIVSRIEGPNKTMATFFVSDNDIGVMATSRYFTHADSLKTFENRHHIGSKPFTAVFEVKGWERTGYQQRLVVLYR